MPNKSGKLLKALYTRAAKPTVLYFTKRHTRGLIGPEHVMRIRGSQEDTAKPVAAPTGTSFRTGVGLH